MRRLQEVAITVRTEESRREVQRREPNNVRGVRQGVRRHEGLESAQAAEASQASLRPVYMFPKFWQLNHFLLAWLLEFENLGIVLQGSFDLIITLIMSSNWYTGSRPLSYA